MKGRKMAAHSVPELVASTAGRMVQLSAVLRVGSLVDCWEMHLVDKWEYWTVEQKAEPMAALSAAGLVASLVATKGTN